MEARYKAGDRVFCKKNFSKNRRERDKRGQVVSVSRRIIVYFNNHEIRNCTDCNFLMVTRPSIATL